MPVNAKIPLLQLGENMPTMMNLSVANEVIKTVNAVRGLEILPAGTAAITISDDKLTLNFKEFNRRDVLVVNPTDVVYANQTVETSYSVEWPTGTACAVDIGSQDGYLIFAGYCVRLGNVTLRWSSVKPDASPTYLSGTVTITAFL